MLLADSEEIKIRCSERIRNTNQNICKCTCAAQTRTWYWMRMAQTGQSVDINENLYTACVNIVKYAWHQMNISDQRASKLRGIRLKSRGWGFMGRQTVRRRHDGAVYLPCAESDNGRQNGGPIACSLGIQPEECEIIAWCRKQDTEQHKGNTNRDENWHEENQVQGPRQ